MIASACSNFPGATRSRTIPHDSSNRNTISIARRQIQIRSRSYQHRPGPAQATNAAWAPRSLLSEGKSSERSLIQQANRAALHPQT